MSKYYRYILIFTLLTSIGLPAFSVYNFTPGCKRAYQDIISLKFASGKALLNQEKLQNPSNTIPYYLDNYIPFLQLFIGENQNDYITFQKQYDERIYILEKGDKTSPYYRYCLAEVYLQWAFVRVKFGDNSKAGFEINKAYRLLEANQKQFPDFVLNQKGLGLVHALIGSVPDSYKWVTSIIGMQGTVEKGINEMTNVYKLTCTNSEYSYLQTETLFMLAFLQLNLQTGDERINKLKELFNQNKNEKLYTSPLMIYCKAIIALKTFDAALAEQTLALYKKIPEQYPFFYLDYLMGLAKLYRLDASAGNYFVFFLNSYKGKSYIQSAYQKLAWYYLIKGFPDKYKQYMIELLKKSPSQLDEDKQAVTEAKFAVIPNTYLIQSRLLFDGGFFANAFSVLVNSQVAMKMNTKREQLEYIYRLGRISHEQNNMQTAISYYLKTIEQGKESVYYFSANAALQLGYIFEKQKITEKAIYYYTLALSMKNEEYVNSISQKAKAGLNRLKTKTGNQ